MNNGKKNILCPHFNQCSGCSHDMDIENIPVFQEARQFFIDRGNINLSLTTGEAKHWRSRAKLSVKGTTTTPLIGLYAKGSHNIVDIPNCQVHNPLINKAVLILKEWIKTNEIEPYNEETKQGVLRYVQLVIERESSLIQLVLVCNKEINLSIKNLIERGGGAWHSIWLNLNTRRDNVIFGDNWSLLYGQKWLWDCFLNRLVCYHPGSFAQANPEMFEKLLKKIKLIVPVNSSIIEYYAGAGVIGLTLVDACKTLCCVEVVPLAKSCFDESLLKLSDELKARVVFIQATSESQTQLLNQEEVVVIVDPPRKGLDLFMLDSICKATKIKKLIYVSCGWKSFVRDCEKLLLFGWQINLVEAFLFFPGSDHLEILCVFLPPNRLG